MTRAVLVLVALLPLALTAQEKEPNTSENRTGVASSIRRERIVKRQRWFLGRTEDRN